MSTINDIATWCTTTMLKRPDLLNEAIALAAGVYQVTCDKVPFEALQTKSSELTIGAGADTLDLSALNPPLAGIMSIRYTAGPGRMWRLRRSDTRVYDSVTYSSASDPRTYARFGKTIELMPVAKTGATARVRYWASAALATPVANTTLVTPASWDELFKWETLYRLYFITDQPNKAMSLIMPSQLPRQMSPKKTQMFEIGIIPRLWNDLLLTIKQREFVDEDFSVNLIMRAYTNG